MARMIDAVRFGEIMEQWKKDCLADNDIQGAEIISDVILQLDDMPTLTQPNDPLTLEQLRQMDEIPIYVVTEKYGSGWCVLNWHGVEKSYTYFSRTGTSEGMTATPLSAKTYGDLWIAYRRPLEGETDA